MTQGKEAKWMDWLGNPTRPMQLVWVPQIPVRRLYSRHREALGPLKPDWKLGQTF